MGYHTVFDVTRVGVQWWIPLLICIFTGLVLVIGWALKTSGDRDSKRMAVIFQLVGAVGILGALGFFASIYGEYHSATNALATHDCAIAEGVVTDFVPMPLGGHATESFRVNGVRFEYGSGWGSTVFDSERNTGFIHNGVQARITYRGKDILKVEVR